MKVTLIGRIEQTEFHEGNHYTTIKCAAPDAYSNPDSYRVRSTYSLGAEGQEIEAKVDISGNVRTRKGTGQYAGRQFHDQNIYLNVESSSLYQAKAPLAAAK